MRPYFERDGITIYHGDCADVLPTLSDVAAVITSPPYAEQRASKYCSVQECEYPEWTVEWMRDVVPVLQPRGSVLLNIRPHLADGAVSDYVLRTRLALMGDGWVECEELIWYKTGNVPPTGSRYRPRRAWESVLWFGRQGVVWSDVYANGSPALLKPIYGRERKGEGAYIGTMPPRIEPGAPTRCIDVIGLPAAGRWEASGDHPAPWPEDLARWLIRLAASPTGVVVDPFMGSGATLSAARKEGRRAVGIDVDEHYCEIAATRLAQGVLV